MGLFTPIILAALLGTSSQASAAAASVITGEFHTIAGTGLVDTFLLVGFVVGILLVPRFGPIRMQSIGSPCRRRVLTGSGWCSWASSCLTC